MQQFFRMCKIPKIDVITGIPLSFGKIWGILNCYKSLICLIFVVIGSKCRIVWSVITFGYVFPIGRDTGFIR